MNLVPIDDTRPYPPPTVPATTEDDPPPYLTAIQMGPLKPSALPLLSPLHNTQVPARPGIHGAPISDSPFPTRPGEVSLPFKGPETFPNYATVVAQPRREVFRADPTYVERGTTTEGAEGQLRILLGRQDTFTFQDSKIYGNSGSMVFQISQRDNNLCFEEMTGKVLLNVKKSRRGEIVSSGDSSFGIINPVSNNDVKYQVKNMSKEKVLEATQMNSEWDFSFISAGEVIVGRAGVGIASDSEGFGVSLNSNSQLDLRTKALVLATSFYIFQLYNDTFKRQRSRNLCCSSPSLSSAHSSGEILVRCLCLFICTAICSS